MQMSVLVAPGADMQGRACAGPYRPPLGLRDTVRCLGGYPGVVQVSWWPGCLRVVLVVVCVVVMLEGGVGGRRRMLGQRLLPAGVAHLWVGLDLRSFACWSNCAAMWLSPGPLKLGIVPGVRGVTRWCTCLVCGAYAMGLKQPRRHSLPGLLRTCSVLQTRLLWRLLCSRQWAAAGAWIVYRLYAGFRLCGIVCSSCV